MGIARDYYKKYGPKCIFIYASPYRPKSKPKSKVRYVIGIFQIGEDGIRTNHLFVKSSGRRKKEKAMIRIYKKIKFKCRREEWLKLFKGKGLLFFKKWVALSLSQ